MKRSRIVGACATALLLAIGIGTSSAEQASGANAPSAYKYSTPIAPGVAVPDKVESSIGTLHLNYGYPEAGTVEKIYDNLDRSRALQAYLMAIPIVNQAGMRDSIRKFGPDKQTEASGHELANRIRGDRPAHNQANPQLLPT